MVTNKGNNQKEIEKLLYTLTLYEYHRRKQQMETISGAAKGEGTIAFPDKMYPL